MQKFCGLILTLTDPYSNPNTSPNSNAGQQFCGIAAFQLYPILLNALCEFSHFSVLYETNDHFCYNSIFDPSCIVKH